VIEVFPEFDFVSIDSKVSGEVRETSKHLPIDKALYYKIFLS
jgi:hypothetical protein